MSERILFDAQSYNPDVLSCLANLSTDEVFTPPQLVNRMLDELPSDIWKNSEARFLDPFTKTGVFLREITKRLIEGLKEEIPDLQTRIDHILTKQVFGIAITELTALLSRRSLYCSKIANGEYSICTVFADAEGNIRFKPRKHSWGGNRCIYCGANKEQYDRSSTLESYSYEFIHTHYPERIFNMQFDVIIGNPPYQLSDGGFGKSAAPIYQKFVEQAKKLNPRYLSMIIPSRWYSGGRGLDSFRSAMLSDEHLRILVDYENFKDVFPGVDLAGGACYFLWDRDNLGLCSVTNNRNNTSTTLERNLEEFPLFIRDNTAVQIIRSVRKQHGGEWLNQIVSAERPFGLRTNYLPRDKGIPCQFKQRIGRRFADPRDVQDQYGLLGKWKLLIPRSPIAGQTDFTQPVKFYQDSNTRILPPGECCTETYLVAFAAATEKEVISFKSYLYTKVARFLLLQAVVSQDVPRGRFLFVPDLAHYDHIFDDAELVARFGFTQQDWEYIDSRIVDTDEVSF